MDGDCDRSQTVANSCQQHNTTPNEDKNGVSTANAANASSSSCNSQSQTSQSTSQTQSGPDEEKIKAILERTGYTLDVTTGQRKYGGPPPDWTDPPPPQGCEIYVGKIPKEIYEDELIPLFEKAGKIWDLRLMMEPMNGLPRGYAFVTYCNKDDAQSAVQQYDGYEIRKTKPLKVNISVPKLRLFVGNIPKSKSKEEIFQEFTKLAGGLSEVIVYCSPDDRKRNRGFCFLEYESHKAASLAKRKLSTARTKVWGCDILVDWADDQEEPDEETMSKVKVLYVRNLTSEVTEEQLKQLFEEFGSIERVKKIKDYAFVHFEDRSLALKAMNNLNGRDFGGAHIEVSLAKPPSDRKKKEEVLRNRERRVMIMMQQRAMMVGAPRGVPPLPLQPPPPPPPPIIPQTRNSRGRSGQTPMTSLASPQAYHHRQLGGRNYDYECGYFGYDDYPPPPHYEYSPHFSGDGYYHHNMLSTHTPAPIPSAPFQPHSKTRASRNSLGQLRAGIRGTIGMTPIVGGLGPRERVRSSGSRHLNSRGRVGVSTGTGQYLAGRPSHHTGGAVYGSQTMGAKSGGNKRRQTAQRRAAKRKLKSKSGENDSKLNRNQQSNESSGALGSGGQWYDDQFASNLDDSWPKT